MRWIRLVRSHLSLPDVASLFVVGGVSLVLLLNLFMSERPSRWMVVGLLGMIVLMSVLRDRMVDSGGTRTAHVYIGVQAALVGALILAEPEYYYAGFILLFKLSPEAIMLLPARAAYAWLAVFSLGTVITLIWAEGPAGVIMAPVYIGGYVFFALFARQTAIAVNEHRVSDRLLAELQTAHKQLQEYASQAEELAVTRERNRLARELHDTLGHRLTVSAVQLQAAEKLIPLDPGRAVGMVTTVRGEIRAGLDELRASVAALRAPVEADLGLAVALRRLAESFEQATGTQVHLLIGDPLPEITLVQRRTLYRAAQEGLTNIQKHAGAKRAWLQLSTADGCISMSVRDDGRGPGQGEHGGFGLQGLRERAALLGGSVALEGRPGGGAQLTFTLPLAQEVRDG